MLYATERELFPTYTFRWNTPRRVRFCLDNAVPFGSSQHQKLIVIDDAVAFTGGLDVTIRRWDTSEHKPDNPLRRDPSGDPYNPFHDVQMLLDGPAARALAELARARWQCVAGEPCRWRRTPATCGRARSPPISPTSKSASPARSRASNTSRRCARSKRCSSTASRPPSAPSISRTSS